jgi:hypothetical protein
MWRLFQKLWLIRGPYSEVSGKWLGKEPLTTFFHHIYEKENYPEMVLDPENIIILTSEEHQKVENDKYFYEEVNKRRDILYDRKIHK